MNKISIIYAYRDREVSRVEASLQSLKDQSVNNFAVIFVDYGSNEFYSDKIEKLIKKFDFVEYIYLDVSHQLWNKSRALNFGIKEASNPFIFIADIDLIFHPKAVSYLEKIATSGVFHNFRMGYLHEKESKKLNKGIQFDALQPTRYGNVNGMILTTRESLFQIKGYDEFYHFYGSEDVDLYTRLENYGLTSLFIEEVYFYHIWHKSYENSQTRGLDVYPRLKNVLRINEQHYLYHKREKAVVPVNQTNWGEFIPQSRKELLNSPTKKIKLNNILAEIEHLFFIELPGLKDEIVEIEIIQSTYFNSIKYRLKKLLNKQTQIYCSLKEVNDLILKHIIFYYHSSNYSYEISKDLRSIRFKIEM